MFILRSSLAVGLALALSAAVSAAPNRSQNSIEGTVVRLHHGRSPQGAGTITIRLGQYRRSARNRTQGGQTRTFAVNSSTRIQRIGQRGNRGSRASLQTLRPGERVRIFVASGQQHAAREIVILANSSNRLDSRRSLSNGSYRRHLLVGSQVLSRHGQRRNVHTNLAAIAHPIAAMVVKHEVKQIVKNHKTIPPKHTVVAKHAPKHHPTHTHSTSHPHATGQAHKPSPAHHKR